MALIGGTGIGARLARFGGRPWHVPTPFGLFRARAVEVDGLPLLLVARHARGHRLPPHLVPYRAFAEGLRRLGIRWCLASAAVGSLRADWAPGALAVVGDVIDLSARRTTLFDRCVQHTSLWPAVCPEASSAIADAASAEGVGSREGAVYVNCDGPRYESAAEIRMMRALGGDVVGMTAGTEAIVMREAAVSYACLAIVTNLAAGLDSRPPSHAEVEEVMTRVGESVTRVLLSAASALAHRPS